MKLRCKAFGCVYDEHNSCGRCGTYLYDGFIEQCGCWFWRFYAAKHWWVMKRFHRHHKCEVCKRSMRWTDDYCCSKKCYDNWELPF